MYEVFFYGIIDMPGEILSEDYWIFCSRTTGRSGRALSGRDGCVQEGDFGYRVSYLEQEEREALSFSRYGYYSIPKVTRLWIWMQ